MIYLLLFNVLNTIKKEEKINKKKKPKKFEHVSKNFLLYFILFN